MTLADCTVMVVEDHEFQRRTTLQILANLGAAGLLEADDGESALALFEVDPRPDIVVCDLDMPGMDGVEFLRRVSLLGSGTAIIIASGLDDGVLRSAAATARGYGLDVLGAIRKPLTARLLLQAVGLHRPGRADGGGGGAADGAFADPWAEALREGRVGVRVRPRVELASGRLGALEVRAVRTTGDTDAAGPPPEMIDAANDARGPGPGETATGVARLVAAAGLSTQRELGEAGDLVDVTLVLPPAAVADAEIVDLLAGWATRSGVELARVCLAIPDARGASPSAAPLDLLTRLRVRGFGLGIDGFGWARVTVQELDRLPLTEVKIAAEALARATASRRGAEAFAATVQSLHDRGLDVVCDGCDSPAEWALAVQAGCRRAQGALVGPELAPAEVSAWLRRWSGVT